MTALTATVQEAIRQLTGVSTNTVDGDWHALADLLFVPADSEDGRIIGCANLLGAPTAQTASAARNFFLYGSNIPTLYMDFANRGSIYPSITFTRASTATRTNSAGTIVSAAVDEPRFDYDPVTLAAKGLLIEEARTNLLLNSTIAGTNLATQSVSVTAIPYTLSFYGTGNIVLSGVASATVTGLGAYPSRITSTFTPTAGTLTLTVSGTVQFAMLEAGSFATSFIPTAGTSATRAADVATISTLTPWFNASEGALLTEFMVQSINVGSLNCCAEIGDGTYNNRMLTHAIDLATDKVRFDVSTGGVAQCAISAGDFTAGSLMRIAGAYKVNDFSASLGGLAAVTDSSGTVPTVTGVAIGRQAAGGGALNGHVKRIAYFPTRLPNANLQGLTT